MDWRSTSAPPSVALTTVIGAFVRRFVSRPSDAGRIPTTSRLNTRLVPAILGAGKFSPELPSRGYGSRAAREAGRAPRYLPRAAQLRDNLRRLIRRRHFTTVVAIARRRPVAWGTPEQIAARVRCKRRGADHVCLQVLVGGGPPPARGAARSAVVSAGSPSFARPRGRGWGGPGLLLWR
jgi:hypothetical protein